MYLDMYRIILYTSEAVRKETPAKEFDDYKIEKVIMEWLRHAKDRNGGRRNRQQLATQ